MILSTNRNEYDLSHPPIFIYPSVKNQFEIDLGTENETILIHETVRYFDYGVLLSYADKTIKPKFVPVEIYEHHLSTNLQK